MSENGFRTDRSRHGLTAYQRDIWTISELFPDSPCYVNAVVAHLVGDIDTGVLADCYERAWSRNDGLRLRFGSSGGVPYQELADDAPAIEWRDVAAAPDPGETSRELIRSVVDTPIDLAAGVPLRAVIIRDGESSLQVLFMSHHVAMDATGLFNFAAHALADYASVARTGQPLTLPSTSFIDSLAVEREYRESTQWTADRDDLLAHVGDPVATLFDRRTSGAAMPPVRRHRSTLDRELVDRIKERGVSFFPYLCAVVGTYLTRVLGTDEVTLGIPLTNRNNAIEMGTVGGHFANTLPLRVGVGSHDTLGELVDDVRAGVRTIKRRQRFPLGDLMNELRRSETTRQPLFDVTVNYVRLPAVDALADILQGVEHMPQGSSPLTLAVNVHELDHGGPLHLVFDYATDVFDVDYPIESVDRHLTALLHAGIDALDSEPGTLPLLSRAERDALVDRSRSTVVPYAHRSTVIDGIMDRAARQPDATALLLPDGRATVGYGDLAGRVVVLASVLRERGVGVGDHVAVMLDRGPDMVVAILATMFAGAAYVPIDPRCPAARTGFVLADCDPVLMIAGPRTTDDWPVEIVPPDAQPSEPPTAFAPKPSGSDAAYVIYTSGSTGKPKGVVIEHHSVVNRLAWMQRRYPIGRDDVVLQKTPVFFDVSVWELFWWAIEGAQVALLPAGAEKHPEEILAAITGSRVTVLHFVPSMLTPFLDLLESAPDTVEQAASLRLVFCSGEALRPHQVLRWNRAFSRLGAKAPQLVNLYGPTEATVDVSAFECPRDTDHPLKRVPIGRPIDNTRTYVLGASGQPQPMGVAGELCIAGVGLARGYLNRPALNAEKFVADPFHPGERMYRTGDLARWLADGQLEYLGRIDGQVKIRGNRVELGEVENALATASDVTDAAVVDHDDDCRGMHLVAHYVASGDLSASALRAHLAQTLPEYMIPALFHRVDHIPLTPSGKADRSALRRERVVVGGGRRDPRGDVEKILADVWQEALGVGPLSVHDNFFDLGGDSILVLRVRALAQTRGILIATRDVTTYPTIAALAEHATLGNDAPPPIQPFELLATTDRDRLGHLQDAYPLTRLQLGMLFHSSQRADSPIYHDVFRYSLHMPWDPHAFGTALDRLIARHPALRTAFDLAGHTEPLALIHPTIEAPLAIVDLTHTPDTAENTIAHHVDHHRHQRYHLDRPGLFHIAVFLLTDRIEVVLSFHHAILDGWSVATIMAELLSSYRLPPHAQPIAPSFAEHVRAERHSINDPADHDYWTRLLTDAPPIQIPATRPHLENTENLDATARMHHSTTIPTDLQARIHHTATAEHLPVKSVYLSAHLHTLALLAGQPDVTTGVITHARPELPHTEHTAGLFLNTMPMRLDTTGHTGRDTLHAVHHQERTSTPHKHLPLYDIQRDLDIAIDVAFNYTNFHTPAAALHALDVELLHVDIHEDTHFTLLLNVIHNPLDNTTTVRIDADPTRYTHQQLHHLTTTYLDTLHHITTTPNTPITHTPRTPTPNPPTTVIDLVTHHHPRSRGERVVVGGGRRDPRGDVEKILADVWQEALGVGPLSVHDNFFDLGGDSILVLRVRALAQTRGILIATRDVTTYPTIAALAEHATLGNDAPPPIQPFELLATTDRDRLGHLQDAYPLTRLQLGMLFHSSQRADSPIYHDVFRYSLHMPWDPHAFGTALDRLIARHPALRTAFDLAGHTEPLALIHPTIEAPLAIVDLTHTPDTAENTIAHHVDHHRHQRYHLDRPGLFHIAVFLLTDRIEVVLSFHHAILDGWSVATIMAELLSSYRLPPHAQPIAPSFAEHVRAERHSINDPADHDYWTRLLTDAPPIQIPATRPHLENTENLDATARMHHSTTIPTDLQARIHHTATAEHLPVKSVYLSAHLHTLALLAGQPDVTTGVITHARPELPHTEHTAGLFLNTMPMRLDTTGHTGRDTLHAVHHQERTSTPHKHLPLYDIQRDLDIAIDVAFNYTNFHTPAAALHALDVELLHVDIHEDTHFTLLLNVIHNPLDNTTTVRIDADPTRYTHQQLHHLTTTYLDTLHHITTTPNTPITHTPRTPTPNPPSIQMTSAPGILALFDRQVGRHPDAVAVETASRTMTYDQLDDTSDRIAAGLLAQGTRPGDRVAVAVDRSPELIATLLAIAKAGAACVPLDTSYPPERLNSMLTQADPTTVVTGSTVGAIIGDAWRRTRLADLMGAARPENLPVVTPEDTAYVLFTSGSTGTPKGVVMPHRALANLIGWQLSVASGWLSDDDRAPTTLQFAPISFDVAFQEIYSTLCGGGRLVLIPEHERHDLPALAGTIARTRVERLILPYVVLQPLAELMVGTSTVPTHLRIIASSGEQLRVTEEIRRLCGAHDGLLLENQYGPTESHVVSSFTMTGDPRTFPELPPIGTPIDNVTLWVLDEYGRPLPDGAPGEIYLAGTALADGYEGRQDLTDEAFVTLATLPGVRLYRTGDVGRRLPGGAYVTDGRRGRQVKIRGHRVEPVEVELALRRVVAPFAGISDVAVVARTSPGNSSASAQLVAFLVGVADDDAERAILASMADLLPAYMIPSRLEWIDDLPRTPSSKRADHILATMPLRTRVTTYVAPRGEREAVVADLFAEVLGVAEVGVFDEFSSLGGDSLSAMRVTAAIEERLGLYLPATVLFAGATVSSLADALGSTTPADYDPCVPLKTTGTRAPLFLVHPIGGDVLCYVELAKHLADDQPLYGLQASGLARGTTACVSIPEMARNYVAAIRRVQPAGPYHLGGWSLGGVIAYEMALQLEAVGAQVDSLLLLDSAILGDRAEGDVAEVPVETLYGSFMWELLRAGRGADADVDHLPVHAATEDGALEVILAAAIARGVLPPTGSRDLIRRMFDVFRAGVVAVGRYRPAGRTEAATLFRATGPLPDVLQLAHRYAGSRYGDATHGWDRFVTRRLEVVAVPGDHLTMIAEPHVAVLAGCLSRANVDHRAA